MAQLVGQNCVHCHQRLGSELDARFCSGCGCPVHRSCGRAPAADAEAGCCPTCGAPPGEVRKWRAVADEGINAAARAGAGGGPAGGIYYATDGWFRRWVKLTWEEDRGTFATAPGEVRFVGRRLVLHMARVTGVELVGPFLSRSAVAALAFGNLVTLALSAGGAFTILTPDNPLTYILLVGVNGLALWSYPLRWVRVAYVGADGQAGVAYFTPASAGIRRAGGAERLFDLFRGGAGGQAAGHS